MSSFSLPYSCSERLDYRVVQLIGKWVVVDWLRGEDGILILLSLVPGSSDAGKHQALLNFVSVSLVLGD